MTEEQKIHILVPKHEKISDKEKEELFAKYNISVKELPRISFADPALAGLNAQVGDVIKITRKSPTSGDTVYYRGVSNE